MTKQRDGKPVVSFNFRLPIELKDRVEKFRDDKLSMTVPGPTWSLTGAMIYLLTKRLEDEGF